MRHPGRISSIALAALLAAPTLSCSKKSDYGSDAASVAFSSQTPILDACGLKAVAKGDTGLTHRARIEVTEGLLERIKSGRKELVIDSKAAIRAGSFELGPFILKSNKFDLEEKGCTFDIKEAISVYGALLARMKAELSKGAGAPSAVPSVLGGFDYRGKSEGFMSDALFTEASNCQSITHIIASLLYDSGEKEIKIRVYPPDAKGYGHLTPTIMDGGSEYDLMAGKPAQLRGVKISVPDFVDAYARAHGLAPKLPKKEIPGPGRGYLPGFDGISPGFDYPIGGESFENGEVPDYDPDFLKKPDSRSKQDAGSVSQCRRDGLKPLQNRIASVILGQSEEIRSELGTEGRIMVSIGILVNSEGDPSVTSIIANGKPLKVIISIDMEGVKLQQVQEQCNSVVSITIPEK